MGRAGQVEEPQRCSTRNPKSLFGPAVSSEQFRTWLPSCSPHDYPIPSSPTPAPGLLLSGMVLLHSQCTLFKFQPHYQAAPVIRSLKSPKTFPRRRQDTKPFPLETTAVSGSTSPSLPIHGAGLPPRECPTLSILIMHLLLIRVLESLAVPTVPATGGQGSE